jgi:hypothetical protein
MACLVRPHHEPAKEKLKNNNCLAMNRRVVTPPTQ